MRILTFFALIILVSCSSKGEVKEPLGANAQQAATQQAADGMANPAVPANEQPPAGTPVIVPPVQP